MLGGYGSDSDSGPSDSPEKMGEREVDRGGGDEETESLESQFKPLQSTESSTKYLPSLSTTGKLCTEVADEERESSPPLTSYGLSGEGDQPLDSDTSDSPGSGEEKEDRVGGEISRERSPLPLPELDGSDRVASSVFSNPYREAEEAKLNVLRRHVDLSQSVEPPRQQRRRSRGRARGRRRDGHSNFGSVPGDGSPGDCYWNDGDSPISMGGERQQRKQRSGVTESLQPPKKYMKIHQKISREERPWTAQ